MPSTDDLKDHTTSSTDFYALLSITPVSSQKELDRAWRRTALKYHPDKVGANDTSAKEKFHLAQIGYDLLSDPVTKGLYDAARNARVVREREREAFEGRRREMRDDLEARERGAGVGKRKREEETGDEERLEREIRRLAEDGKRRRNEREEALRREMAAEARGERDEGAQTSGATTPNGTATAMQGSVSEVDRIVRVRWPVEGEGGSVTAEQIKTLFSKFGPIESADLLQPKMLRLGEKKKKQLAVTCMLQYKSVVGAHAAVEDFPKQEGPEWQIFDSVFWVTNKEPDFISASQSTRPKTDSPPSTPTPRGRAKSPFNTSTSHITNSTLAATPQTNAHDPKEKPSFNFSPAGVCTPKSSPFGKNLGTNSPSLEELTMIRLKNAEKKRLAAQIEREDREADAAAAKMERDEL
ncbi:hypothetical protein MMC21_002869 [Puttea exsequens]|nr:hypothetical protein [Puttea exsequens]